jgi:hypothetical protein
MFKSLFVDIKVLLLLDSARELNSPSMTEEKQLSRNAIPIFNFEFMLQAHYFQEFFNAKFLRMTFTAKIGVCAINICLVLTNDRGLL